jgi:hypothetical protein
MPSYYYREVCPSVLGESDEIVETLSLRVERHNQNALALALWLKDQAQVS